MFYADVSREISRKSCFAPASGRGRADSAIDRGILRAGSGDHGADPCNTGNTLLELSTHVDRRRHLQILHIGERRIHQGESDR